jgi:hypothetical protein
VARRSLDAKLDFVVHIDYSKCPTDMDRHTKDILIVITVKFVLNLAFLMHRYQLLIPQHINHEVHRHYSNSIDAYVNDSAAKIFDNFIPNYENGRNTCDDAGANGGACAIRALENDDKRVVVLPLWLTY